MKEAEVRPFDLGERQVMFMLDWYGIVAALALQCTTISLLVRYLLIRYRKRKRRPTYKK